VICSENVAAPAVGEGDPLVIYTPGDREAAREDGRGTSVLWIVAGLANSGRAWLEETGDCEPSQRVNERNME
jgi:hypothetical protein